MFPGILSSFIPISDNQIYPCANSIKAVGVHPDRLPDVVPQPVQQRVVAARVAVQVRVLGLQPEDGPPRRGVAAVPRRRLGEPDEGEVAGGVAAARLGAPGAEEHARPAAGLQQRRLGADVKVTLTQPCIFCVENH